MLSELRNDRRGTSALEFALILPISALMLCGTLQYGVLFYTWNVALNAARNAARAVAVGRQTAANAETMITSAMPPWVQASGVAAADVTDAAVGGEVVASVSMPTRSATMLPLAPMPETLSVSVRMVKEA